MRPGLTRRVAVAGIAIVAVVAATVVVLLGALDRLDDADARGRSAERAIAAAAQFERFAVLSQTSTRGFALTGDDAFLAPAIEGRTSRIAAFADVRRDLATDRERAGVDGIQQRLAEQDAAFETFVELVRRDPEEARARIAEGRGQGGLVVQVREQVAALTGLLRQRAEDSEDEHDAAARAALIAALVGCGITAALVGWGAISLRRRVARPLEDIAGVAGRLAAGDRDARAAADGRDEIARLQRSFNEMADALAERERALQDARDAAQEQVAINEAVLETTPDGMTCFGEGAAVLFSNRAMERYVSDILGRPARIGERLRTVRDVSVEISAQTEDPAAYVAAMDHVLSHPDSFHAYQYDVPRIGRTFVRITAPVMAADGQRIGGLVLLRDVSAERAAERAKDDLMAAVSHELRTPLASILGFAELLETRELPVETQRRYAGTIHQEARRLTSLVDDLIDLRLVEEGRLALSPERVDVGAMLREQAALFARRAEGHELRVDAADDGALVVQVDRLRLGQVIGNLLSNAIKYSPSGGVIDVGAEASDGRVRISIRDEGLGIPASQQDRLFERFFRADRPAIRHIGGSGIGLALTRELVHALGGEISFVSSEGEGSTFWVELDLSASR